MLKGCKHCVAWFFSLTPELLRTDARGRTVWCVCYCVARSYFAMIIFLLCVLFFVLIFLRSIFRLHCILSFSFSSFYFSSSFYSFFFVLFFRLRCILYLENVLDWCPLDIIHPTSACEMESLAVLPFLSSSPSKPTSHHGNRIRTLGIK